MTPFEELNEQLKVQQAIAAKRDVALRLSKVPEFKELILDQFMVTECARYAQLSQDPALSVEDRANSLNIAQSAGHLKRFLSVIVQMGNNADNQITQINEALEELRSEDAE